MPVSCLTFLSHSKPTEPMPSNAPGLVRGFQMPARNILTPLDASNLAVSITCSSVSALQGPAMTNGFLSLNPGNKMDSNSILSILFNFSMFDQYIFCILVSALFRFSSVQHKDKRMYLSPLLPKINPGVMKTLASY